MAHLRRFNEGTITAKKRAFGSELHRRARCNCQSYFMGLACGLTAAVAQVLQDHQGAALMRACERQSTALPE